MKSALPLLPTEIMPHATPWTPLLMAVALLAACNDAQDDRGDGEPRDPPSPTAEAQSDGDAGARSLESSSRPVCLEGGSFLADGPLPLDPRSDGDAARVGELRWEGHEGCERFVIDLMGEEGSPAAAAGDVRARLLRRLGVVRIDLREVESVDPQATDARFDGPLARAAYAVWSPEGRWTYVDLHLADAAEARVLLLADPARVVVDLRPGGGGLPAPAASGQRVVVLEPRPGPASYPLTVSGYARTFEANVVARLERSGERVHEDFTTATAWVDAWGHYSITIPDGPPGPVRLHVGEHSARDGTWEGVAVDLEMNGR